MASSASLQNRAENSREGTTGRHQQTGGIKIRELLNEPYMEEKPYQHYPGSNKPASAHRNARSAQKRNQMPKVLNSASQQTLAVPAVHDVYQPAAPTAQFYSFYNNDISNVYNNSITSTNERNNGNNLVDLGNTTASTLRLVQPMTSAEIVNKFLQKQHQMDKVSQSLDGTASMAAPFSSNAMP